MNLEPKPDEKDIDSPNYVDPESYYADPDAANPGYSPENSGYDDYDDYDDDDDDDDDDYDELDGDQQGAYNVGYQDGYQAGEFRNSMRGRWNRLTWPIERRVPWKIRNWWWRMKKRFLPGFDGIPF